MYPNFLFFPLVSEGEVPKEKAAIEREAVPKVATLCGWGVRTRVYFSVLDSETCIHLGLGSGLRDLRVGPLSKPINLVENRKSSNRDFTLKKWGGSGERGGEQNYKRQNTLYKYVIMWQNKDLNTGLFIYLCILHLINISANSCPLRSRFHDDIIHMKGLLWEMLVKDEEKSRQGRARRGFRLWGRFYSSKWREGKKTHAHTVADL